LVREWARIGSIVLVMGISLVAGEGDVEVFVTPTRYAKVGPFKACRPCSIRAWKIQQRLHLWEPLLMMVGYTRRGSGSGFS